MNVDNAYYGSLLHFAYLTCKCIVRINAYLKYLTTLHFPLESMAHTHYKNHPVEIKLYIYLQSSELAVGYILMRQTFSIALLQYSQ